MNNIVLSSDASTSWGMSGVVRFLEGHANYKDLGGLFWQMSWDEWDTIQSFVQLSVRDVKINVAEFLAVLITFETFTSMCAGKFTTMEIDNKVAKSWWDSSRCPISPFDRCAQGVHLHMLKEVIKIKTEWIPSKANALADSCSRNRFSGRSEGHVISGIRMKRVRPKFTNVLRFL